VIRTLPVRDMLVCTSGQMYMYLSANYKVLRHSEGRLTLEVKFLFFSFCFLFCFVDGSFSRNDQDIMGG
jgi:hypothetical protein